MAQTFHHRRIPDGTPPSGPAVTITDDGKDYVYHMISRRERAAFKTWATDVFAGGMNRKRLVGSWPHYTVKQPA